MATKTVSKWQYGDFQTPHDLAEKVVNVLKEVHKLTPATVIEPTCGTGAFVIAAGKAYKDAKIVGFEINPGYVAEANAAIAAMSFGSPPEVRLADFFRNDWKTVVAGSKEPILILGNPPWVTSSELGMLRSSNTPTKSNFQNRKGIEAITGAGNFDISEWMLLKHLNWLSHRSGTIAYLCKLSVARKVMLQAEKIAARRFSGAAYLIDAKAYFNAAVEACLFVVTTGSDYSGVKIFDSLDARHPSRVIGERDGSIVNNTVNYEKWRHFRGKSDPYIWRSGVKHDCAKIMELAQAGKRFVNGLGSLVDIEGDCIYPLLKSSDVGNSRIGECRKFVLVTQKAIGSETKSIEDLAPKTWRYLVDNRKYFDARKSSIYNGKPAFSIFGVGEYTFKPWKIAISGMYKNLRFNLVGPLGGKPVLFDDTVNFLSFDSDDEARFVFNLITSSPAIEFLDSMIFWDEKRPVTTEILRRLNLAKVAAELNQLEEFQRWTGDQESATAKQLLFGAFDSEC